MSAGFPSLGEFVAQHQREYSVLGGFDCCTCGWTPRDGSGCATYEEHVEAAWREARMIRSPEQLDANWPMGAVIQEVHTGACCEEPHCDFYEQLWVMQYQMGWMPAGAEYYDWEEEPRLPARLLWHPEWGA